MGERILDLGLSSAELLDAIVEKSHQPVFLKDRAGRHVWMNEAACAIMGLTPEVAQGKTSSEMFAVEVAGVHSATDRAVFEGGEPVVVEDESITDAAGGLAHQIRTPLGSISNAIAVVRQRLVGVDDPIAAEAVAIIGEEIREANRIITDLLDFARVRPADPAPTSVAALLDGALTGARALEGVTIERDDPEDLYVLADELQARDALQNLVRNALEAMAGRGRLTLRARAAPPFVVIAIEDTGPGVAEAALAHLFEPLITTKPLGLGLGLTTARALIENQEGDVRCARTGPSGACFEVRLPLTTRDG